MGKRLKIVATATGAKAQNVEYLTSDINITEESKLTVVIVSQAADDLQITFDSGSTWSDLTSATTALTYT